MNAPRVTRDRDPENLSQTATARPLAKSMKLQDLP